MRGEDVTTLAAQTCQAWPLRACLENWTAQVTAQNAAENVDRRRTLHMIHGWRPLPAEVTPTGCDDAVPAAAFDDMVVSLQ
jgi:hypothetical protein